MGDPGVHLTSPEIASTLGRETRLTFIRGSIKIRLGFGEPSEPPSIVNLHLRKKPIIFALGSQGKGGHPLRIKPKQV